MHPFQTFAALSDPTEAARRLSGVTFAVSATGWLADYLPSLAERLEGQALSVPDELRPLYHASAVLACGYVGTLLDAAVGLWTRMGYTEEDGVRAVAPLARATVEAIAAAGPVRAVTGPAVTGRCRHHSRAPVAAGGTRAAPAYALPGAYAGVNTVGAGERALERRSWPR